MSPPLLRRRLYFWCGHGILKEVTQGHFTIQSSVEEQGDTQGMYDRINHSLIATI
jgi:hypothetical protein